MYILICDDLFNTEKKCYWVVGSLPAFITLSVLIFFLLKHTIKTISSVIDIACTARNQKQNECMNSHVRWRLHAHVHDFAVMHHVMMSCSSFRVHFSIYLSLYPYFYFWHSWEKMAPKILWQGKYCKIHEVEQEARERGRI